MVFKYYLMQMTTNNNKSSIIMSMREYPMTWQQTMFSLTIQNVFI